jgi:predicted phosphodiesterase
MKILHKRWTSLIQVIAIIVLISAYPTMLTRSSPAPQGSPDEQVHKQAPGGIGSPEQLVPTENLRVAFVGDQGLGANPAAVLQLIEDEGADLVIHLGDFDYTDDPDAWNQQINDVLGADFPYFIAIGNHDVDAWNGYQTKFQERLALIPEANCGGDLGVKSYCVFEGLFILLSGAGTMGSGHSEYITEQLAQDHHLWKICAWHKNQNKMQVGAKTDEVGWGPYEACRAGGAIVATGHEHSYSRTYLMSSFENQVIASTSSTLDLLEGQSFAFLSGLGGKSIRPQLENWTWMASIYTADQSANYGALFCTFHVDGAPNKAQCQFKDLDGSVPDQFDIVSHLWDQHTYLPLVIQ